MYDQSDRITGADYRNQTTDGNWAEQAGAYSLDKVDYDLNGNITALKRYGLVEESLQVLDDLTYTYQGNRLRAVQDVGQATLGFADGANEADEYAYDRAGNLTEDKNKDISKITYDAVLNLPLRINFADGRRMVYTYDATGTKLRQKVVQADGSEQITDYAVGFQYTDGVLDFVQHDEGRLILSGGQAGAYHYDLKDHLGNSRVTFSNTPITTSATASMEASAAPVEEQVFEGVAESRRTMAFHNTTDASSQEPDPNQVASLLPGQQGPSKSLQVNAGDTVKLQVNARYETVPSQVQGLEGIATEIAGAAARTATGLEGSAVSNGLNGASLGGGLANSDEQEVPHAYLNYLLYDEDYQLINQGFQQVSEAAAVGKANPNNEAEQLTLEVPVAKAGYLYAYLSNEGANLPAGKNNSSASGSASARMTTNSSASSASSASSGSPVYFDDFTVEQQSYIVQVNDYMPFGMTFQQPLNNPVSKYLWSGKERQTDLGLNWDDFGARFYDPALGRFHTIDPLADAYVDFSSYAYVLNNPLKFVDPDGKKVLYVNGYWQDSWLGRNIIGSSRPGRAYWGSGFVRAASQFFNDGQRGNGMFIDGSSQWGGDESGSERYTRGYEYAKEHYDELVADMQQDETFKLVTHSEGGAFGAGIAQYLLDQGKVVETILHLSTDEADEFSSPKNTTTYQLGYGGDWVTGNKEVAGADIFGVVDKFSSDSDKVQFAHGSTKGSRVFNDVKALLKAAASGSTGVNVTETSSGVRFEFIRVNEDEQEE